MNMSPEEELAALRTNFDDYIASSRELEEELDAELENMQKQLSESSAANDALVSQIESLTPQLNSLETALSSTRQKLEQESKLRRKAELAQDEAESRTREAECSVSTLREENDALHEELAFKGSELEESRNEIEELTERYREEMENVRSDFAVELAKNNGNANAAPTSDDTITEEAENENSQAEYIKSLEDELELVTEELIEVRQKFTTTEAKLNENEEMRLTLESELSEKKEQSMNNSISTDDISIKQDHDEQEEIAHLKQELLLTQEELTLTNEELSAVELDSKDFESQYLKAHADLSHNQKEINSMRVLCETAKNTANEMKAENTQLEGALKEANLKVDSLQDELNNIAPALKNAKDDYRASQEELEALNAAFNQANKDADVKLRDLEQNLLKKLKESKLKVELLEKQNADLTEKLSKLQRKLDVEMIKNTEEDNLELPPPSKATNDTLLETNDETISWSKKKSGQNHDDIIKREKEVEHRIAGLYMSASPSSEISPTNQFIVDQKPKRNWDNISMLSLCSNSKNPQSSSYEIEDDIDLLSTSSNTLSRSRCKKRQRHRRARSCSPCAFERLEDEACMDKVWIKELKRKVGELEEQLDKKQKSEQEEPTFAANVELLSPKSSPQPMMDIDLDEESRINKVLNTNDLSLISTELTQMTNQTLELREHNASLLGKIMKLQENIQVCCRVRPQITSVEQQDVKVVVEPLSETEVGCFDSRTNLWKSFAFDKIWGPDVQQHEVFRDVEPLAMSVVEGYSSCILAYGQTGSGKTYTMEGNTQNKQFGISQRTITKIFHLLKLKEQHSKANIDANIKSSDNVSINTTTTSQSLFTFSIEVGMLEIYNEEVYDLLAPSKPSREIRLLKNGQVHVPDLTKEPVKTLQDVMDLLSRGNASRSTASTNLNEHSSRSHMVLHVQVTSGMGDMRNEGNLFLVDLAGSERVRKSEVIGQELKEARHINKSLSALGDVMEALDRKASHIPYRNSKLTYILQNCLGGSKGSKTLMVVTVCPGSNSFHETQCALQFATRARRINLGVMQRNVTSKNLEEKCKKLNGDVKLLSQAKERAEKLLTELRRDHHRIQERLASSQECRTKSHDETRTVGILRKSNADMTGRWQKEKAMCESKVMELDKCQKELRKSQQQLRRASTDRDHLAKRLQEKESILHEMAQDLRKAKDDTTAASVRARRAEIISSRMSPRNHVHSATPNGKKFDKLSLFVETEDLNEEEDTIRQKILILLQKHDLPKAKRIDQIMEKYKGCEQNLLDKLRQKYQRDTSTATATVATAADDRKKRSLMRNELALARHKKRIQSRRKTTF